MVDDIMANNSMFFQFAFVLRKSDPTKKYTKLFLSRIKPQVLYEIVESNVWDDSQNGFVCEKFFKMTIGKESLFQYHRAQNQAATEPQVRG